MAPEVLSDKEFSKISSAMIRDVYSFANIVYEIVIKKIPFKIKSLLQLFKKVALDGERPIIDDGVIELYTKLIALHFKISLTNLKIAVISLLIVLMRYFT
ncbi:hypothetical protein M9Y10_005169 [Tritrichomonas musculus]|uniref:Protein kinase domain-containing protein n=1 Tax=Tritrichomonas musculus TaxID=1915356 RepID=A0ABR2JL42_9EUKA